MGMVPGGGMSELPRYRQILEVLRDRIARGEYKLGGLLPTEADLCAEFATSRYTVREALRRLVQQGLLSRRQKTGTIVIARDVRPTYVQSIGSVAELFQFSVDTHFVVLGTERVEAPPPPVPDSGEQWQRIDGIRSEHRGGRHICYNMSYIPARLADLAEKMPASFGPFYTLLADQAQEPITHVVQEITAAPMPAHVAAALNLPQNTNGLCVHRRYVSAPGVLIASFNWHEAEQFVFRMELGRSGSVA
jgi:DNA-binding GntR family transcriptional regulator